MKEKIHSIIGYKVEVPFWNAAGLLKLTSHVAELINLPVNIINGGAATIEAREGNPGHPYFSLGRLEGALNSLGLPNAGLKENQARIWPESAKLCHETGKLLSWNIAGFTPLEYGIQAQTALECGIDLVELNLSCPNVWNDGVQHECTGNDVDRLYEVLDLVQDSCGKDAPILVKVPPYITEKLFNDVAQIIKQAPIVKGVITMNTLPKALGIEENGKSILKIPDLEWGYSGLSGHGIHPFAIGQARQWVEKLIGSGKQVIGVGGVISGRDGQHFLDVGCDGFQVGTLLHDVGPKTLIRLTEEWIDIQENREKK